MRRALIPWLLSAAAVLAPVANARAETSIACEYMLMRVYHAELDACRVPLAKDREARYQRLRASLEQFIRTHAKNDPENSARFGDKHRFGQELPQNVAAARADRFTHADFFCPLGHAYEHDVHDADARRHQSDKADDKCADAHHARYRNERALERIVGISFKIVFLVCA